MISGTDSITSVIFHSPQHKVLFNSFDACLHHSLKSSVRHLHVGADDGLLAEVKRMRSKRPFMTADRIRCMSLSKHRHASGSKPLARFLLFLPAVVSCAQKHLVRI